MVRLRRAPGPLACPVACAALLAAVLFPGVSLGREGEYSDWLPLTGVDWAIEASDSLGIRHAARIFDGLQVDDRELLEGARVRRSYYRRVRVFDAEGVDAFRTLEVPIPPQGKIAGFAARVAKPDGRFLDVASAEIREKKVIARGSDALKAKVLVFPSVDPGDILEWRFTEEREWSGIPRVQFRRDHYVVRSELTWWYPLVETLGGSSLAPDLRLQMHYLVMNPAKGGAQVKGIPDGDQADRLQVTVAKLPALPDEPYLPATEDFATYFVGWYGFPQQDATASYWLRVSKQWGKETDEFVDEERRFDEWLKDIKAQPRCFEADLDACLRLLHGKVRNRDEIPDAQLPDEPKPNRDAGDLLESGHGTHYDLAALYTGMLRRLGYAATVFHACSRADGHLITQWENFSQFSLRGTAVAMRGDTIRWVFPSYGGSTTRTLPWDAQGETALLEEPGDRAIAGRFSLTSDIPTSGPEDNRVDLCATVRVEPDGDLAGRLRATWRCESDPDLWSEAVRQQGKGAADYLEEQLGGFGSTVRTFDETAAVDSLGVSYACSLRVSGQVQGAGDRMLVNLSAFRSDDYSLPDQPRECPVHFRYPKITRSRVVLVPPDGFTLEAADADSISKSFLRYRFGTVDSSGMVVRNREFALLYSAFNAGAAETLRPIFRAVSDLDARPVILRPVSRGKP